MSAARSTLLGATELHTRLTCTVVICTRNRAEQLDTCIAAVLAQRHARFDILIVDNASTDPSTERIAATHGVRCVREEAIGLSKARNRGALESSTDIVAYIDDDAVAEAGWLENLCAEFEDPLVMGVSGGILPLRPNTEGSRLCLQLGILDGGSERLMIDRESDNWFDRLRAGVTSGANMAIRRDAFRSWNGFDPRLGLGAVLPAGEEDYAFLCLVKRGYRIIYTPNAVVRHPFPDTLTDVRRRHLRTLTTSAALLAFFFVREPDCRGVILRHLLHRLERKHRRSYSRAPQQARKLAPIWCEALAGLRGLSLFSRSLSTAESRVRRSYRGFRQRIHREEAQACGEASARVHGESRL
jgi:glycosyltransferase involved in cell wall biosynthesis